MKATVRKYRYGMVNMWCAEACIDRGNPLSQYRSFFRTWEEAIGWALNPHPQAAFFEMKCS